MHANTQSIQIEFCKTVGALPYETSLEHKVGISQSALDSELPLNGLRHLDVNETTGWYIWGGAEFRNEDDFFLPMHVWHLERRCVLALKFLLLPPGWRFLTDGSYEDVWFDEKLRVV